MESNIKLYSYIKETLLKRKEVFSIFAMSFIFILQDKVPAMQIKSNLSLKTQSK